MHLSHQDNCYRVNPVKRYATRETESQWTAVEEGHSEISSVWVEESSYHKLNDSSLLMMPIVRLERVLDNKEFFHLSKLVALCRPFGIAQREKDRLNLVVLLELGSMARIHGAR